MIVRRRGGDDRERAMDPFMENAEETTIHVALDLTDRRNVFPDKYLILVTVFHFGPSFAISSQPLFSSLIEL